MFSPDVFALGVATGVLGLLLLFSLIIAYAYDEPTLFALAGYLLLVLSLMFVAWQLALPPDAMAHVVLILGPTLVAGLHVWMLHNRQPGLAGKAVMGLTVVAALAMATLRVLDSSTPSVLISSYGLGALLVFSWLYLCLPAWRLSGAWKWWLLQGHGGGTLLTVLFLAGVLGSKANHWPVAMMLLLQLPPTYLALVWRSRMLNEGRLRGLAAKVTDPLTGLSSLAVLADRLRPAVSRAQQLKHGGALYLIAIQNLPGLLGELGAESKEKILLEAANRIRRAISDTDSAARINEQVFAVLAQDLRDEEQVDLLATRLVVSGLRIESDHLPGVALQFRVIVSPLHGPVLADAGAAQRWVHALSTYFDDWPGTHRSRSILRVDGGQVRRTPSAVPTSP